MRFRCWFSPHERAENRLTRIISTDGLRFQRISKIDDLWLASQQSRRSRLKPYRSRKQECGEREKSKSLRRLTKHRMEEDIPAEVLGHCGRHRRIRREEEAGRHTGVRIRKVAGHGMHLGIRWNHEVFMQLGHIFSCENLNSLLYRQSIKLRHTPLTPKLMPNFVKRGLLTFVQQPFAARPDLRL
jgi:hypothetical protein